MKVLDLIVGLLILGGNIFAQNPICPLGTYIADPTARVWPDGKLYIYGSTDESPDYWCSYKHDVLYTSDLKSWTFVPNIFSTKGDHDAVPETDALLFAPDVQYRDGRYFLYFCTPSTAYSEGVAVSDTPLGPFRGARKLDTQGYDQIDPTIFIDDDGQAYYYWGQKNLKAAKMKSNMMELDTASIRDRVLTVEEHFFHEGAFAFKRAGLYYLIFADESRRGKPTCLGYATSKSPMGPFTYRGVIIDNYGCDPGNWNNHGSVAEFNRQWYVFYHRSSHGSQVMRRACMEPIYFQEDGSIQEVEMTSQGAGEPLSATKKIEAVRACLLQGSCRVEKRGTEERLCIRDTGDAAGYKYIDFADGVSKVVLRGKVRHAGLVRIRLNRFDGPVVGTVPVPVSAAEQEITSFSAALTTPIKGKQALYLEFVGEADNWLELDSFYFEH